MTEYLKAQSKTNEIVINHVVSDNELRRFSASDERWASNRTRVLSKRAIRKGDIYQFEFGKNYSPEMSYEHRGLVIGKKGKLLYVLPIYSFDAAKMTDVYHPIDYPESKSDLYLLKQSEFPFIRHDSVLKLNDLRSVSVNRILYAQPDRMDISTATYKKVEELTFQKYFPDYYLQYKNGIEEIARLKEELHLLKKQLSQQ